METRQYQLLYRARGTGGAALRQTLAGDAQVEVRDINTQDVLRLRVRDVSLYRHILLLDGKPHDLMNIFEMGSGRPGPSAEGHLTMA